DYLIGRQAVITVDRTIISVICIGSVTPRRVPPARIPVIPTTVYENDTVVVIPPPDPVVPRRSIISEGPIILTLPVLASLNSSVLLKLHRREFCRTCVRSQIEMPRLVSLGVLLKSGVMMCLGLANSAWALMFSQLSDSV